MNTGTISIGKKDKEARRNSNSQKFPNLITQVSKEDEKKLHIFQRILQSPCCRPFIRCFSLKEKYFHDTNSLSSSTIIHPHVEYLIGSQLDQHKGRKTLVLDLDETLVHSSFENLSVIDIILPVKIQNYVYTINVVKRPGVEDFLMKMGQCYEVVVFTASLSEYAIPLVKELDKLGIVVHMLFREHCTSMNGIYVKDLSRLGRDLKDVIIVDNSPNSFLLQPENAFHIKNFFEDKTDMELYELAPFLEFLANVEDVRPIESWRKKYTNLSKSLTDPKKSRKVNTRQESTVPLNHESISPEIEKDSHNNSSEDDDDDDDLELEKKVKDGRNSKRDKRDVSANKIKVPPLETSKTNTHDSQTGNDLDIAEPYLPSPKESDNLIKFDIQAKAHELNYEKYTDPQARGRFKFENPDGTVSEDTCEKKDLDDENDYEDSGKDNSQNNDNSKVDDIRYLAGHLNPNSPISKTTIIFKDNHANGKNNE